MRRGMISCAPQPNQALQASPSEAEQRQQDSKEETYVGKYLASWQWQPLDSIGTIWRVLRVSLFDLLGIFWSCQGRGREFESRFPLQSSPSFISRLSAQTHDLRRLTLEPCLQPIR